MIPSPRRKTRTPIASFGPRLMALLLRGSLSPVLLKFPTDQGGYRLAIRFQQRLHMLRSRMLQDGHEKADLVARARTSLRWGGKAGLPPVAMRHTSKGDYPLDKSVEAHLLIQPHDAEFDSILAAAGVGGVQEHAGDGAILDEHEAEAVSILDEYLASTKPSGSTNQ